MLKYVPRQQFIDFHNRKQRWAVLCTHRRAGKTVSLVNDVIFGALECQKYRPQFAYVGPTYSQAKKIAWQYLKDYAAPYFGAPPSEASLKVTLKNDAIIYVLGADNADSLRGIYLDGGVGDEYALFKPSVFSQVIRPALSDRNGWWIFASTPRGKNLFHGEYIKALKNPQEYYSLMLKSSASGIIPTAELEALRQDMDPEEFAQEYECSFDSALKGAIYAEEVNEVFFDGRIRQGLYDPNLETHAVFDLGFTDATVGVYWQEDKEGNIRVLKAEATTGVDIFHHIDKINEFPGPMGEIWLPHDARAKNLQTGRSVVEQFLEQKIRPSVVPQHKVRDRIAATRKIFARCLFEEGACDDLLEALKGYRREWDDKYLMFLDKPLHDWCSDYADAFGYMGVVAGRSRGGLVTSSASVAPTASNYNLATLFQDRDDMLRASGRRIG